MKNKKEVKELTEEKPIIAVPGETFLITSSKETIECKLVDEKSFHLKPEDTPYTTRVPIKSVASVQGTHFRQGYIEFISCSLAAHLCPSDIEGISKPGAICFYWKDNLLEKIIKHITDS